MRLPSHFSPQPVGRNVRHSQILGKFWKSADVIRHMQTFSPRTVQSSVRAVCCFDTTHIAHAWELDLKSIVALGPTHACRF